ncbi:hypothetical protein BO94DRAFT_147517 [Aspergillus sclerotioniger CBS 115572]|uniref:Uncharacterized protein n=1 Tax=Aspergillus sclerotioniger CBS 115572 TaxID=1450535 RepID=A0A317W515_9EURO|nr:hypothetical protein BO94DRAFT_147517 [Aspergillus sclerotioniger CBS 115572]PWY81654.1 hypothetical protein BO94DRAFT_147517 [Aspergillus sclerotioniger CBS 115572]
MEVMEQILSSSGGHAFTNQGSSTLATAISQWRKTALSFRIVLRSATGQEMSSQRRRGETLKRRPTSRARGAAATNRRRLLHAVLLLTSHFSLSSHQHDQQ